MHDDSPCTSQAMAEFSQVLNLLDGQATPNPHMMPRDDTQRSHPRECVDGGVAAVPTALATAKQPMAEGACAFSLFS